MKLNSDVTTLIALFAIVNPITAIPVFLAIAKGLDAKARRKLALKTALIAGVTLFIAYFLGDVILKSLSIELDAFRIAGSMVIAAFGWKMVTGRGIEKPDGSVSGAAIVPLAIPLMAGPGAIATVIALGNSEVGITRVANLLIIVGLTALTFIFLLAAAPIEKVLGETGLMVVSRILGLLLLAIAMSTVISALGSSFPGLLR
ncbi:MAG: MarC family protein [Micrococcales bacterium]